MKQTKINLLFNRGFKVVRTSDWGSREYPLVKVTKDADYKQPEKLNWGEKLWLKIPTYE